MLHKGHAFPGSSVSQGEGGQNWKLPTRSELQTAGWDGAQGCLYDRGLAFTKHNDLPNSESCPLGGHPKRGHCCHGMVFRAKSSLFKNPHERQMFILLKWTDSMYMESSGATGLVNRGWPHWGNWPLGGQKEVVTTSLSRISLWLWPGCDCIPSMGPQIVPAGWCPRGVTGGLSNGHLKPSEGWHPSAVSLVDSSSHCGFILWAVTALPPAPGRLFFPPPHRRPQAGPPGLLHRGPWSRTSGPGGPGGHRCPSPGPVCGRGGEGCAWGAHGVRNPTLLASLLSFLSFFLSFC